jgi:hypothetical protein
MEIKNLVEELMGFNLKPQKGFKTELKSKIS